MKTTKILWCGGLAVVMAMLASVSPGQGYSARHHEIVSEMQTMARGAYTEAEWNAVIAKLDTLLVDTRAAGDWEGVVETQVIRAKVMSARGDHAGALTLMQDTLKAYGKQPIQALKKVYVEIAALYAREGNQAGVKRIMDEFKKSPHYDGRTYSFSGGTGPDDPLMVPRPSVAVGDSVSVTAMQVQKTRAGFAPGNPFPDFNVTDWQGRALSRADFHGKVLLVDFWADGWFIWRRDLEFRRGVYDRHRNRGFEIIGMHIGPDADAARVFAQAQGMIWPLASAPRPLIKTLGIFGDATNFLLDQTGTIIGRDLYGADLEEALRRVLP